MKGLEGAVGVDIAAKVTKECRVHYTRSVERVSGRVNKGNPTAHRAFTTIAYQIPDLSSKKDVITLFDVLSGDNDILDTLTSTVVQ